MPMMKTAIVTYEWQQLKVSENGASIGAQVDREIEKAIEALRGSTSMGGRSPPSIQEVSVVFEPGEWDQLVGQYFQRPRVAKAK